MLMLSLKGLRLLPSTFFSIFSYRVDALGLFGSRVAKPRVMETEHSPQTYLDEGDKSSAANKD